MKKFARTLCVLMLTVVLGASCFALTACPGVTTRAHDNESFPLVFSVQELDNVFNPFFATSAFDMEIMSQTQISMISSDKNGNPYCSVEEPTAVKYYNQVIYYRANENEEFTEYRNGEAPSLTADQIKNADPDDYFTRYQFLIKNNIKFSDGVDLTINDVLFNLYTYLDPTYYGSSTVYSTNIKGLLDYRTQIQNATDNDADLISADVTRKANSRLSAIRSAYIKDSEKREKNRQAIKDDEKPQIYTDVETVRRLFYDEITSDYQSAASELESYIEEQERIDKETDPVKKADYESKSLGFTEVWEIFLYNEGLITAKFKTDGSIDTVTEPNKYKDKKGNFIAVGQKQIDYADTGSWWHDKDSLIKIIFNENLGLNENFYGKNYTYDANHAVKSKEKDEPDSPENGYGPVTDMQTDTAGKATKSSEKGKTNYESDLWNSSKILNNIYDVVTYWGTASTAREQFAGEERTKLTEGKKMVVPTISGIKALKYKAGEKFESIQYVNNVAKTTTETLDADYYVLQIDVEKVDPKAIWNFAFAVAPMHYYSNADNSSKFTSEQDYRAFYYPIYDSNGTFIASDTVYNGKTHKETDEAYVGRPFNNVDYMNDVIKASKVISVPVGAGPYQVAEEDTQDEYYLFESDHKTLKSNAADLRPTLTEFSKDNIVYYIRNPYFYTTSGEGKDASESSINNCLIKFIRYQVISSTKLLDSILQGQIHYGDPNATTENVRTINNSENIESIKIKNNGYGYIGINASYVPDLPIRQAIMTAMDISLVKTYYGEFADLIYRPISSVSWASPQNDSNPYYAKNKYKTPYYFPTSGKETDIVKKVKEYIGQVNVNGNKYQEDSDKVLYRILEDGTKHRLEYTFTIAGSTDDHPAYNTMKGAADILNKCGFKITVKTDANALSKLAAGTLTVWAAAWGSTIDPDMYQVYHMDSTATSVRNWGYPDILDDSKSATYGTQKDLVKDLSNLIDEARTTLDQRTRQDVYLKAFDAVMELAVELPTYQRDNIYAYNSSVIDGGTLLNDKQLSSYRGPLAQLWKVSLK